MLLPRETGSTPRKFVTVIVLGVSLAVTTSCSAGVSGSGTSTREVSAPVSVHDLAQPSCEDSGFVWAGSESGCLTPSEVGRWKTSGCDSEDYYTCQAKGFPDFWDMPENQVFKQPPPEWLCSYSPTYDYDWHNDVLCTNGTQDERPYLREGDNFVTEDELMESARDYERQLNGE